jgi:hypothetical protein
MNTISALIIVATVIAYAFAIVATLVGAASFIWWAFS